jgi:excinuclease ABC subunit B
VTVPRGVDLDGEVPNHELPALIESLRVEMKAAAKELDFERAADLRDRIRVLEAQRLQLT